MKRPELGDRLVAALTAATPTEVGLTTGLQGAGGFGKTRLATWVCHRPEITQRYPGGLLWMTVGQEVRGADLAERNGLDEACTIAQESMLSGRLVASNHWRALEVVRTVEDRGLPEAPDLREAYQLMRRGNERT